MEIIDIISYKHDGELHRIWKNAYKIFETDDVAIIVNNKVDVIDGNGRTWKTREPAICYFFKKYWFNIICMIRTNDVYYYCNLSSPYIIDEEGLKYIDYDLDVKLFPDGEILLLDRDEFDFNIKDLKYPDEILDIIKYNLKVLIEKIKNKEEPFDPKFVYDWYNKYLKLIKNNNQEL